MKGHPVLLIACKSDTSYLTSKKPFVFPYPRSNDLSALIVPVANPGFTENLREFMVSVALLGWTCAKRNRKKISSGYFLEMVWRI